MTDWSDIVSRFGPIVWATAYRLLGRQQDALDCYQETFMAAIEVARRKDVVNWPALLKCLAVSKAVDQIRRRAARREVDTTEAAERFDSLHAREPSPVQEIQATELMDQVRRGLAQLPPKQAQVFWLRCVDGLGYEEIAAVTGLGTGAVGVLLHRARARLRKLLERTVIVERQR